MTSKRMEYAGSLLAIMLLIVSAVFLGNQRLAHADIQAPQDPGLPTECSDLIDNDGDGLTDFVPVFGDPDCENIFDTSESGSAGGGGGNPPLTQCMDGIDNDSDGQIDLADSGCVNVGDNDESDEGGNGGGGETPADVCPNIDGTQTEVPSGKVLEDGNCVDMPATGGGSGSTDPSPSTGGSGGGSGGYVLGTTTAATTEMIATTTPVTLSCDTYLTTFIKMGLKNDVDQVKRLQSVLKDHEGADVEASGEYDGKTEAAVRTFQRKYASDILTPWGIKEPTGYVFLTTRKKVNEVYCKNAKEFPLTEEEQQRIELAKKPAAPKHLISAAQPKPAKPVETPEPAKIEPTATPASVTQEQVSVTGNPISNFFRRLLNRFR